MRKLLLKQLCCSLLLVLPVISHAGKGSSSPSDLPGASVGETSVVDSSPEAISEYESKGSRNTSLPTGFLGDTTTLYIGNGGVWPMYAGCQADYGDGAKVCSSKQLLESYSSGDAPINGDGTMWVRPYIVAATRDGNGKPAVIDYSGYESEYVQVCPGAQGRGFTKAAVNFTMGECSVSRTAACCR